MAERPIHRISANGIEMEMDDLAEEVVISILSNDETVVRLLATPSDLEDLAIGHVACESLGSVEDLRIEDHTVILSGDIRKRPSGDLLTAACGACTQGDIEDVSIRVNDHFKLEAVPALLCEAMREMQPMFASTGGVHAAALADANDVLMVREDIGRHNAVDKVVGAALRSDLDPSKHCLVLSGRLGWELVAKSARVGIEMIVSVGAISTAAADLARSCGMTLVGFATRPQPVVVGDTSRIIDKP